jgi:hypothetical protein
MKPTDPMQLDWKGKPDQRLAVRRKLPQTEGQMLSPARSYVDIREAVEPLIAALRTHRMYGLIHTLGDLRVFVQHHVYAVWDFMSLLKRLQREYTCTTIPWVPKGNPQIRRIVNELVLEEESDEAHGGGYGSHYELYLSAMARMGADIMPVVRTAQGCRQAPYDVAVAASGAPLAAQRFVLQTLHWADDANPVPAAAAFCIGRENVIPTLFNELVGQIARESVDRLADDPRILDPFSYYLDRHIALDGGEHSDGARRILEDACGDNPNAWALACDVARQALRHRLNLWEAIALMLAEGRK